MHNKWIELKIQTKVLNNAIYKYTFVTGNETKL